MNVPLAFKVGRKNESKWDLFDRRNRGVSILIVLLMGRFLHAQPSEAASPMRYRILSVTRPGRSEFENSGCFHVKKPVEITSGFNQPRFTGLGISFGPVHK